MEKNHKILASLLTKEEKPENNNRYFSLTGQWFLLLSLLLSIISCEKVIQLDFKNADPKIVIQANIYDSPGPYQVKISKSVSFEENSLFPAVSGAKVVITDNISQTETLTEAAAGTYVTSRMRGIPGRTYTLTVTTGAEVYKSIAAMPQAVSMDSIYFSSSLFSGDKLTTVRFLDPPYQLNYYRLIYYINSKLQKEFYVLKDDLFDGTAIRYALHPRGSDIKLVKGDIVTVWLESVDPGVYNYFRTAGSEDGTSASPANPVSNISNGALGYFNACAVRKITAMVDK